MPKKLQSITSKIPAIVALCLIVLAWYLICISGLVPAYMLPSPVNVAKALISDMPLILMHARYTLQEAFYGLCIGILIGCAGKLSYGVKSGIGVLATLFPSFFAGLMFGGMKNVIEQNAPIINRINPASVLSDAFYCISVYDDAARYHRCILILACMCLICIISSFLLIRRERYDSI